MNDDDLTLEKLQKAVDWFMDQAYDCCEQCGARRAHLVYIGLAPNGRPLYWLDGGCEHQGNVFDADGTCER